MEIFAIISITLLVSFLWAFLSLKKELKKAKSKNSKPYEKSRIENEVILFGRTRKE